MKKLISLLLAAIAISGCDQVVPQNVTVDFAIPDKSWVISTDLKFLVVKDGVSGWMDATGRACVGDLLFTRADNADGTFTDTPILNADSTQIACANSGNTIAQFVENVLPVFD